MIKKSIAITEQQNEWLKAQLASGDYGNESEVFRDLIRERQQAFRPSPAQAAHIRTLLKEGEESGFTSLSRDEMLAEFKQRLKRDGKL